MTTIAPSGPVSLGSVRGLFDAAGNLDLSAGAIFRNGNVGIGTTNPTASLDVSGLIRSARVLGTSLNNIAEMGLFRSDVTGNIDQMLIRSRRKATTLGTIPPGGWLNSCFEILRRVDDTVVSGIRFGGEGGSQSVSLLTGMNGALSNERLTVTETGNVGIGTTNPLAKLSIGNENGGVFDGILCSNSAAKDNQVFAIRNRNYVNGEAGSIEFIHNSLSNFDSAIQMKVNSGSGSVDALRITSNGNVGIGTANPSTTLDVNGKGDFHSIELLSPSGINGPTYVDFSYKGKDYAGRILYDNCANYFRFDLTDSANNSQERMRILGNGNVGIGTDVPGTRLELFGSGTEQLRINGGSGAAGEGGGIGFGAAVSAPGNSLPQFIGARIRSSNVYWAAKGHSAHLEFQTRQNLNVDVSAQLLTRMFIRDDGLVGVNTSNPTERLHVIGNILATGTITPSSDDRLKVEESHIADALPTILKLRPQVYRKLPGLEDTSGGFIESGLIAQEVYYDAPELRHLVKVPEDASGVEVPPAGYGESSDPNVDPDYSNWGSTPAALNYIGLIPYLIRGMQEQEAKLTAQQERIAALEAQLAASST